MPSRGSGHAWSKRLSGKLEGEAPAEPQTPEKAGSAGASPSRFPASRTDSKLVLTWKAMRKTGGEGRFDFVVEA